MTTTPKVPSAEAQRRAAIKQRRETSVFWASVHLLGSLKLAVGLLITIAGAIAFATVMESKFDTAVARYYIYDAAWFGFWLLALGLNLLCAALSRWPWQRKHLGFVVTHAGIILMLIGAVVGKTWGFEAFVTLDKTKPPATRLLTKDDLLTIETSGDLATQVPLDLDVRPPTERRPLVFPLAGSNLRLVVDRVTDNLIPDDSLVASGDTNAPAGIALHFVNAGMGQNVAANLMLDGLSGTFDFFGMARIEMVDALDEAHLIALPPAPEPAAAPSAARNDTPFRETQVVFANSPQTPVVDTDNDVRSGYDVKLMVASDRPHEFDVTVTAANGVTKTWPLRELEGKWTSLQGDGDPILFRVAQYWPEFAVKDGTPVSLSDQPRNPAVLVQITGPSKLLPPAPPKPVAAAPPMPQGLVMRVAPAKEPGRIVYELERAGKIEARGLAAAGDSFMPGWSKWQVKVDAVLPHAELHREVTEFTGTVTPMMAAALRTGIRAHLVSADGTVGESVWIPGGTSREIFCGNDFDHYARVGFGQRVIPLNFTITLEDFQVPRDEGTDTPSDYISSVRFDEPATGRVVRGTAHMNEPAMFPGDFWRSVLGWNYKFSQANWNPQNLNETTLQVLYDPGWIFKWTGSICISIGIALMFYFMPKRTPEERRG